MRGAIVRGVDAAVSAPPSLPVTPRWLVLVWDWGPAAVAVATSVLVAFSEGAGWLVLGLAAAVLLGLRARAPLAAWLGSLAVLGIAAGISNAGASLALFLPTLPLAAVSAARAPRTSLAAALMTFAALCAAVLSVTTADPEPLEAVLVAGVCVALAASGWLIGYALLTRRRYAAALEERARWLEERRHDDALRAALLERQALARELHDVVSHNVSVMTLQASAAGAVLEDGPASARDAVAAVEATGRTAMGELRAMLAAMRAGGDGGGTGPLEAAPGLARLDALVAPVRAAGLVVELDVAPDVAASLPAAVDLSAYRIVQEALTNALRHAGAERVVVRVARGGAGGALALSVADDGRGLRRGEAERSGGHGIAGMRERAALLGGTLEVSSADGSGTVVRAELPLEPRA